MLALLRFGEIISQVAEGGPCDLPDGRVVSPAQAGWELGEYSLVAIVEAGAAPSGKRIASRTVELVGGVPTYVNHLVDLSASELSDYAAQKRFAVETGGIMVGGAKVRTDRESQAMISGAYLAVQRDPQRTINWKTEAGFVTVDAATMTTIADAVAAHVQACFDVEAQLAPQIAASQITTFEQIDAANWPSTLG